MDKPTLNNHQKGSKPATRFILVLLLTTCLGAVTVLAQETGGTGSDTDEAARGINCVICRVANLIFMIIAALAAIVIILAGLKWLTSGDDPGARNAAKTAIVSAFVGIVIVFVAVYVVSWVVSGLPGSTFKKMNPTTWITGCDTLCDIKASSGTGTGTGSGTTGGGAVTPSGTCAAACGGEENYICLVDCLGSPDKGHLSPCGEDEKCCCTI